MENKVRFGLRNAHYALITENEDGSYTYAAPVRYPGATSLTLTPRGESTDFYADDILYYSVQTNQGYDTTFTVAEVLESFRKDVLGEDLDATDKVLTEKNTSKPKKFAFMFEFDGDVKSTRHLLTNCTAARPGNGSTTKGATSEPGTTDLSLIASPRPSDGVVKVSTTAETPQAVYDNWYKAVYEKAPGL
jgi:phi13 family phage major tail protein